MSGVGKDGPGWSARATAAPTQASTVEDEFLALVYADPDWLRDEFEELIAASWDDEPPASDRPLSDPPSSGPRRRPVARAREVPTRSRPPDASGRARSPPARQQR